MSLSSTRPSCTVHFHHGLIISLVAINAVVTSISSNNTCKSAMEVQNTQHQSNHSRISRKIFQCIRCQRLFNSDASLRQHIADSLSHNLCTCCSPPKDFEQPRSLRQHSVAISKLNENRQLDVTNINRGVGLGGVPRSLVELVFRAACSLRRQNPQPHTIATLTKTSLDLNIVSAILTAALRLLPPDNSSAGRQLRLEKERLSAERAKDAEAEFIARIANFGVEFLTEAEQRSLAGTALPYGQKLGPTPDLLLKTPLLIDGHPCAWIEFKNDFGFKSSPFVTSGTKRQVKRYLDKIGPGIVVYRLGFESGLFAMPGVVCMRETEALEIIGR